jgi:Xaa-Pro aminopeptidase
MGARLATLDLPDFGLPTIEPTIPAEIYRDRLKQLYERAEKSGYDVLVVYADREHFANLSYLTGYDPRFEEALLICDIRGGGEPVLLVGNEGISYLGISPIKDELEVILYQPFSLMGQARDRSDPLETILQAAGVEPNIQVGVAGWKYFTSQETDTPLTRLEIPAYIADILRNLTGKPVHNAGEIFMHPGNGLRAVNDVHQLARFEFAACYTSQAVRNVIFGLQPGMTEFEVVDLMKYNGLPLSCHLMVLSGERAFLALASPSTRRLQRGEPFSTAFGVWGALNCRAGFLVESADELPEGIKDYVDKLVKPYFEAVAAWYAHIGIGVPGAELYRIIHERIDDPFFGVGLNPGHLIHLEEWVHSPIYEGSTETLKSGMAIQVDVIPATHSPYFTINIEDGIALADEALRADFARLYPEAWRRIQQRRAFMENSLGIKLKPEVLPFSNLAAYLPPFLLSPHQAMTLL